MSWNKSARASCACPKLWRTPATEALRPIDVIVVPELTPGHPRIRFWVCWSWRRLKFLVLESSSLLVSSSHCHFPCCCYSCFSPVTCDRISGANDEPFAPPFAASHSSSQKQHVSLATSPFAVPAPCRHMHRRSGRQRAGVAASLCFTALLPYHPLSRPRFYFAPPIGLTAVHAVANTKYHDRLGLG